MVVSLGPGIGFGFSDLRCLDETVFYQVIPLWHGSAAALLHRAHLDHRLAVDLGAGVKPKVPPGRSGGTAFGGYRRSSLHAGLKISPPVGMLPHYGLHAVVLDRHRLAAAPGDPEFFGYRWNLRNCPGELSYQCPGAPTRMASPLDSLMAAARTALDVDGGRPIRRYLGSG